MFIVVVEKDSFAKAYIYIYTIAIFFSTTSLNRNTFFTSSQYMELCVFTDISFLYNVLFHSILSSIAWHLEQKDAAAKIKVPLKSKIE